MLSAFPRFSQWVAAFGACLGLADVALAELEWPDLQVGPHALFSVR